MILHLNSVIFKAPVLWCLSYHPAAGLQQAGQSAWLVSARMGSPAEITMLLLHFQSDHYRNASFWCDTAQYRLISKAVLSIQQHVKTGPGWSGSQTPLLLPVTEGGRRAI